MEPSKTLTDLSVVELKALAYDALAETQRLQGMINAIGQELAKRSAEPLKPASEAPSQEPTA